MPNSLISTEWKTVYFADGRALSIRLSPDPAGHQILMVQTRDGHRVADLDVTDKLEILLFNP